MFQFPRFPSLSRYLLAKVGFPIRRSWRQCSYPARPGLSQVTTSFIGSSAKASTMHPYYLDLKDHSYGYCQFRDSRTAFFSTCSHSSLGCQTTLPSLLALARFLSGEEKNTTYLRICQHPAGRFSGSCHWLCVRQCFLIRGVSGGRKWSRRILTKNREVSLLPVVCFGLLWFSRLCPYIGATFPVLSI